jgi:hypothetical protein
VLIRDRIHVEKQERGRRKLALCRIIRGQIFANIRQRAKDLMSEATGWRSSDVLPKTVEGRWWLSFVRSHPTMLAQTAGKGAKQAGPKNSTRNRRRKGGSFHSSSPWPFACQHSLLHDRGQLHDGDEAALNQRLCGVWPLLSWSPHCRCPSALAACTRSCLAAPRHRGRLHQARGWPLKEQKFIRGHV